MPAALSNDLRKRIIDSYQEGGKTQAQVAAQFRVSLATVVRLRARVRKTGSVAPTKGIGGAKRRSIDAEGDRVLREILEHEPDLTIVEIKERLEERTGCTTSTSSVSRALARMNVTRKKRL